MTIAARRLALALVVTGCVFALGTAGPSSGGTWGWVLAGLIAAAVVIVVDFVRWTRRRRALAHARAWWVTRQAWVERKGHA